MPAGWTESPDLWQTARWAVTWVTFIPPRATTGVPMRGPILPISITTILLIILILILVL
ncbi:MAG: hypothetical protein Q4G40_08765 [Brachybacterium sp.]|nr:hypothetical protein [Brachybacterium sp.]